MNTNQRSLTLVAAAILLLATVFYLFGGNSNRVYWGEHYRSDSQEPYGTYVIHELLPGYLPNSNYQDLEARFDSLPSSAENNSNYIYIGNRLRLDSLGIQAIIDFVDEGNTAFIAAKNIPYKLMEMLYPEYCDEYTWSDFQWGTQDVTTVKILNPPTTDSVYWKP